MSASRTTSSKRTPFTVVFAQTVFHSTDVLAETEDEAIERAADQYESDTRLFPSSPLPRTWRRWWGSYEIDGSFPTPVHKPKKKEIQHDHD